MQTRIIKTGIFTDEKMLGETPDIRFICVYLYTNSHIGLSDIYKIPVQLIQLETGFDITIIKLALDRLKERGILVHHNYLWVKLLRHDFASLVYSGEKNEVAKRKQQDLIPDDIVDYFNGFDTSMDTSIDSSYKSEIINHKSRIINQKPEKDKFGELQNVKLTPEEHNKLIDRFNEAFVNEKIFDLDNYIASTGKKYQSHYATILAWAKRDYDKGKQIKNNVAFS